MVIARRDETVELFRERLEEVIRNSGLRRSAFARRIGIDRSTLYDKIKRYEIPR